MTSTLSPEFVADEVRWTDYLQRFKVARKFDENEPRDDQGKWTDGGGAATGSFADTFKAAGLRAGTVEGLPKGAVEALKFQDAAPSPGLQKALTAVTGAFKDLEGKPGVVGQLHDLVAKEVQFLVGTYEPNTAAMTSVTGDGKAFILVNAGLNQSEIGTPGSGFAYGGIAAAALVAGGASHDDAVALEYKYALYHEMGHMLDKASNQELRANIVDRLILGVGGDDKKIRSWISKNISPYAATSPSELAAEVVSIHLGGGRMPKQLVGLLD